MGYRTDLKRELSAHFCAYEIEPDTSDRAAERLYDSTHGKKPNRPHPSGHSHQAIKMDCQKRKEVFISSLTRQWDNGCLLQVQRCQTESRLEISG